MQATSSDQRHDSRRGNGLANEWTHGAAADGTPVGPHPNPPGPRRDGEFPGFDSRVSIVEMTHADGILDRVSGLAGELKLAALQPQIAACRKQFNGGSRGIDVAVFGRFKAGKSSFLNHLTGRAVLPIGVVPLTAVITRLRYGPVERAEAQFLSGDKKAIALDEIGLYVGENQNPNNEKKVAAVQVELPALKPLDPLQFVDTPGLGSAFAHNTEATRDWLPNVGAALVAISSDAPLSERDLDLLEELRRHTPKIVLLLTKADLLSAPQRTEVLEFVRRQLHRKFGPERAADTRVGGAADGRPRCKPWAIGDTGRAPSRAAENPGPNHESLAAAGACANSPPTHGSRRELPSGVAPQPTSAVEPADVFPVFFYSVRPEESALKPEFERKLLSPLVQNRDAAAEQIARHKLRSLVGRTLNYLRIALAAATRAESSRQALREKLDDERRQFDLLRSELRVLSREGSASALDWYLLQLEAVQDALQDKITDGLRAQFPRWNLRLPPLLQTWREWLDAFLKRELNEVSHGRNAMFCEPLRKAQAHLTRTLLAFHDRLAGHVKSALGVTLAAREFTLEVREPSAPPVHVAYAFDAAFTTIGWLVPLTLFRNVIQRQLLRKGRCEVEKNLSRLAADWRDRVARIIDELTGDAEKQALDELAALEHLLKQSASNAPELKQAIDELEQFQSRLG